MQSGTAEDMSIVEDIGAGLAGGSPTLAALAEELPIGATWRALPVPGPVQQPL